MNLRSCRVNILGPRMEVVLQKKKKKLEGLDQKGLIHPETQNG